jgi:hypothetical protein
MGAQPSPHANVLEAVDHFLAFFLSLLGAGDGESGAANPGKAIARKRKAGKETRG